MGKEEAGDAENGVTGGQGTGHAPSAPGRRLPWETGGQAPRLRSLADHGGRCRATLSCQGDLPARFQTEHQIGRGPTRLWDFHPLCHHFIPLDKRSSWPRCLVALALPASEISRRLGTGAGLAAVGGKEGCPLAGESLWLADPECG